MPDIFVTFIPVDFTFSDTPLESLSNFGQDNFSKIINKIATTIINSQIYLAHTKALPLKVTPTAQTTSLQAFGKNPFPQNTAIARNPLPQNTARVRNQKKETSLQIKQKFLGKGHLASRKELLTIAKNLLKRPQAKSKTALNRTFTLNSSKAKQAMQHVSAPKNKKTTLFKLKSNSVSKQNKATSVKTSLTLKFTKVNKNSKIGSQILKVLQKVAHSAVHKIKPKAPQILRSKASLKHAPSSLKIKRAHKTQLKSVQKIAAKKITFKVNSVERCAQAAKKVTSDPKAATLPACKNHPKIEKSSRLKIKAEVKENAAHKAKVTKASKKSLALKPIEAEAQTNKSLDRKKVSQKAAGAQIEASTQSKLTALSMAISFASNSGDKNKQKSQAKSSQGLYGYKIEDLLFMILTALCAGAQTVDEILTFLEKRKKWLKVVLGLTEELKLPTPKVIWSLLWIIDAKAFQSKIIPWLNEILSLSGVEDQALPKTTKNFLTRLYLWDTPHGPIIGQAKRDAENMCDKAFKFLAPLLHTKQAVCMTFGLGEPQAMASKIAKKGGYSLIEIDQDEFSTDGKAPIAHEDYVKEKERITFYQFALEASASVLTIEHETFEKGLMHYRYYVHGLCEPKDMFLDLFPFQVLLQKHTHWMIQLAQKTEGLKLAYKNGNANWNSLKEYAQHLISSYPDGNLSDQEKMKKCAKDSNYWLSLLQFLSKPN